MKTTVVICALVAGLSGCTSNTAPTKPTSSPTPTTAKPVVTKAIGKMFISTAALASEIESKTSVRCPTYEVIKDSTYGIEGAECSDDMTLGIFESKEDAKDWASGMASLLVGVLQETYYFLIGENWGVNCGTDKGSCDSIQSSLGGELLVFSPEK